LKSSDLQQLLQQKLNDYSVDLPADDWEAMASRLDAVVPSDEQWRGALQQTMATAETSVPKGDWKKIERRLPKNARRRVLPLWLWNTAEIAAVAAVAALLLALPMMKNAGGQAENTAPTFAQEQKISVSEKSTSETPLLARNDAEKTSFSEEKIAATPRTRSVRSQKSVSENSQESSSEIVENQSEKATEITNPEKVVSEEENLAENQSEIIENQPITIDEAERLMAEKQQQLLATLEQSNIEKDAETEKTIAETKRAASVDLGVLASLSPNISKIFYNSSTSLPGGHIASRGTTHTTAHHDLPFTIGLSVGIPLYERLDLQTGLNYSYAHSVFNSSDRMRGINVERNQQLHYLGIPLMLSYRIVDKQVVKFYVSLGGACEKALVADQRMQRTNTDGALLEDKTWHENIQGVQGSLLANVGVAFCFYKGMSLYFEPGFAWYIPSTRYQQPSNSRTEHPYNLSLTAGLRFNVK
jgi:hypothetical protein